MKNILIIKTSSLGDIVQTYPVIVWLHEKFPTASIDWIVESSCASLVTAHPFIDRTLIVETKEWRKSGWKKKTWQAIGRFVKRLREKKYDMVFDLQGNVKSGLMLLFARSPHKVGFGFNSVPEWPNVLFTNRRFNHQSNSNIRHDYLSIVTQFCDEKMSHLQINEYLISAKSRPLLYVSVEQKQMVTAIATHNHIMVAAGSIWPNKRPNIDTLIAFLKLVQETLKCIFLLIWGSAEEYEVVKYISQQLPESKIVDKMSLPMLQHLMNTCNLVIATDSLPLHLCGTTSTPSYSVFGPSFANKYKPVGSCHGVFQGACPYGRTFAKRCPILRTCDTGACLHSINERQLFDHFMHWWYNLKSEL